MKKIILFLAVAFMVVILFSSCNKKDEYVAPKTYASFVAGEIVPQFGDIITLKSAPIGVTNWMYMYNNNGGTYTLVNGDEFLPGSDPDVFWSTAGNNPGVFNVGQTVYSNYTPAKPIRVIIEQRNAANAVAFLGIKDLTPSVNSFPLNLVCRRLGDKLTINTDALTALPGYTNMSFKVSYNVQPIDVAATKLDPINTNTDSNWPTLHFGASVLVENTISGKNKLDQVLYDEVEGKITGDITITISVDHTTIVKTTPASSVGHGLALTLTTDKVGWYDSQNMSVTQADITVDKVEIPVK